MNVLVVNAGSSSLKYQFIDTTTGDVRCKGICERIGSEGSLIEHKIADKKIVNETPMPNHSVAMKIVVDTLTDKEIGCVKDVAEIEAIGHRVVHGGPYFFESCLITPDVLEKLRLCIDLAPLHTPAHIMGIEGCTEVMPTTPQVLVFDTAFHQTMPAKAYHYPISKDNDQSYDYFMNDNLFSKINVKKENIHILNGMADDAQKECENSVEITCCGWI